MDYITLTGADHNSPLLADYFNVRAGVYFCEYGATKYTQKPESADLYEDTHFKLAVDKGRAVAGLRIVCHPRGSVRRLPFERHNHAKIEELLPHLDAANLSYAEIGGLAAVNDAKYRGMNSLGSHLLFETLGHINEGVPDVDLVLADVRALSATIGLWAARKKGVAGIVRTDVQFESDGIERVLFMCSRIKDFPFLSEDMKRRGVGRSINDITFEEARAHCDSLQRQSNVQSNEI